jgi:hypothetical protein
MRQRRHIRSRLRPTAIVAAIALLAAGRAGANTRVPFNCLAHKMTTPVTVDGRLVEWQGLPPVLLMHRNRWEPASQGETYGGPADAAVRFYAAWDAANLYLAVEAYDNDLIPPTEAGDMLDGDCIVVAIDARNDASQGYRADDAEFGFAYARPSALTWRWFPSDRAGFFRPAKVAIVREMKPAALEAGVPPIKLTYEVAVPWHELPAIAREPGRTFGFDLAYNDADSGRRHGWLRWTPGLMGIKDPSRFGNIHLADPLPPPEAAPTPKAAPDAPTGGSE